MHKEIAMPDVACTRSIQERTPVSFRTTTKSQPSRTWLRRKARTVYYRHREEWKECIARCRKVRMVIRSASVLHGLIIPVLRPGWPPRWIFTADAQKWNNSCGNQHVRLPHARDLREGYRESCRRIHFGIVGLRYLRCGITVDISCGSEIAIDRDCPEQIRCYTWEIYRSSLWAGSHGRNWKASRRSESSIGNDGCNTK